MNNYSLYIVTNNFSKKMYVGVTKQKVENRFLQHLKKAISGNYRANDFYLDLETCKSGEFKVDIISETLSYAESLFMEYNTVQLMKNLNLPFYNVVGGGKYPHAIAKMETLAQLEDFLKQKNL